MKFFNLGSCSKPCGILKWRGLTIMFDCPLDLIPVLNFLPLPLAGNSKFNSAPNFPNFRKAIEKELCELGGYVLVDSTPLFGIPTETCVDISEIDVILVSNSVSILALPFYTENPDFKGNVYATEPTVNIGRFFMEELVEFVQSVPKAFGKKNMAPGTTDESSIFKLLDTALNFPIKLTNQSFNKELKEIYTKKSISDALLKVRIVGFSENTTIYGNAMATAVSSGYSLGSCNWVLKGDGKKIAYVTNSSTLTTHPSPMEQPALKDSDIFILTGLTLAPTHNPDAMMGEICLTVMNTLRGGGNVVFPCYPSGIIYDLFECLASHLDTTGYGSYPFYFIAPHSETSLAYSNILAEWLSSSKQRRVYIPEDPFTHAELAKIGRLKHYKTLHDISEVRQPCILFCGHPCLRFGDIVHVIESWGSNHANTIIFTEAEFSYIECLIPYQPLAMKAVYCPIDTSLNFHQANKLIKDLKPSLLVTQEEYLVPPLNHPHRLELTIDYPTVEKLGVNSYVSLKLNRKSVNSLMDPKMARDVDPSPRNGTGVLASTITANLDNTDNKNRLIKPAADLCDPLSYPPKKYTWGYLDSAQVLLKLNQEGISQAKLQMNSSTGFLISLPNENATITVEGSTTHLVCGSEDNGALRLKLRRILSSCLTEF